LRPLSCLRYFACSFGLLHSSRHEVAGLRFSKTVSQQRCATCLLGAFTRPVVNRKVGHHRRKSASAAGAGLIMRVERSLEAGRRQAQQEEGRTALQAAGAQEEERWRAGRAAGGARPCRQQARRNGHRRTSLPSIGGSRVYAGFFCIYTDACKSGHVRAGRAEFPDIAQSAKPDRASWSASQAPSPASRYFRRVSRNRTFMTEELCRGRNKGEGAEALCSAKGT
jgi:hypothetical protein